jgi:zinc protease
VTAAQVKDVVARRLGALNRTVGWSVPPRLAALARPGATEDDPAPPLPEGPAEASARKADPPAEPDAKPTFRGGREAPLDLTVPRGPAGGVVLAPRVETLPNGMTVLLLRRPGPAVVSFAYHCPAGQLVESKPGIAYLTGDLLDEGAGERSSVQIAETLDFLGASLGTGATGARARCLAKDSNEVLGILADCVRRPRFDADDVAKVKGAIASELAAEADDPGTVGRNAFAKALYGDHPMGRPGRGDRESVASLTREDVVAHHSSFFTPDRSTLAVVGDFDPDAMAAAVRARFGDWKASGVARPALPEPKPLAKAVRIDLPMEGKSQSNVFLGNLGIRRNDPDYAALLVMDYILGTGPGFSDRLSKDLRDEQGLAYTVRGNVSGSAGEEPGTFTGYVACLGTDLDRAIAGMQGHIRRIREEPVTEQELADAKSYLQGSLVFRYETSEQIAGALIDMHRFGLGFDYPAKFPAMVDSVTREDVLRVAKKHLHADAMALVVSGWTGGK